MDEELKLKLKELKQEYEQHMVDLQKEYDDRINSIDKGTSNDFSYLNTKEEKVEAAKVIAEGNFESIDKHFVDKQKEIINEIKQSTGENFDYLVENLAFTLKFVGEE